MRNQPRQTPYYQSQLQVLYERDFFPWVISDALKELVETNYLIKITEAEIPNFKELKNLQQISFYIRKDTIKNKDDFENILKKTYSISKVVNGYSDPALSKTLGDHLEALVKAELRARRFCIIKEHANEFEGKKWTKTEHDLDFIAVHENGKLKIGVEVKNTLSVIPPDEIDAKILICEHLGICPVFAVRWIKPYFFCISNQGGFCWMFKTQCYPLGFEEYTQSLYNRLSDETNTDSVGRKLGFPITVRKELPEPSVRLFEKWVENNKNNPPVVDTTSDKCSHKTLN